MSVVNSYDRLMMMILPVSKSLNESFKGLKVVGHELWVSGTHFVSPFGASVWGSVQGAHLGN